MKNTDLTEKFNDWFHELEGFGLRSERFYEELEGSGGSARVAVKWLKIAFLMGARTAAQDSVDACRDYATAVAGIDGSITREQGYDNAAESLMVYFTKILDNAEKEL